MIDSYLSDELLVETNHDVLRHLENCPACRSHLASCRVVRLKARSALVLTTYLHKNFMPICNAQLYTLASWKVLLRPFDSRNLGL